MQTLMPAKFIWMKPLTSLQIELAGDALLPLMLAEPATYQALGSSLLAAQAHDPRAQAAIHSALGGLAAAGVSDLSRASKRTFRQRLCRMVADVRGLLKVK